MKVALQNISIWSKGHSSWRLTAIGQFVVNMTVFFNSSPPGQNGRHFADDIFRRIFANEKSCIFIKISLKFVPKGPLNNNPALV